MTFEQLRIFVAVAEREHVTRAAEALNLTQSAVSSAISALEQRHDVRLFHRVGRGITLTDAGHALLKEARTILASVTSADLMLSDFGGLRRGRLRIAASQTVGGYWLPRHLHSFRQLHPGITIDLDITNSESVVDQVLEGRVDCGLIEGELDHPALIRTPVDQDRLVLVHSDPPPPVVDREWLVSTPWILREEGSGTRATLESALREHNVRLQDLTVALTLSSNEAVRSAAEAGAGAAVLSTVVVDAPLSSGRLNALPFDIRPRTFSSLRHRDRYLSRAEAAFLEVIGAPDI